LSWWLKKGKDEDKSEEQWKTIWVVVLIVIILVLLSGLTASVAVFILNYNQDQTQRWTKGVEGYPAWEEVVDLILEAEQNLPEIVNVGVIGRSSEGRPIHSVTVGGKDKEEGGGRLVWIICGLHAREWMSVLACIHILQALIQDLASDPDLQKFDFKIVPLANPDGYVFSMLNEDDHHFENRLKRKNMRDSGCLDPLQSGVDLNRNFPVAFNLSSQSDCYPVRGSKDGFCGCSETYGGPQPFSEPETSALRNALTRRKPWIFVDIHASLGAWFTPPVSRQSGNGTKPNAWNLDFLTKFLKEKFDATYMTGALSSILGEFGGTMLDWVNQDLGVQRAYALELASGCHGEETLICIFQCPIKVARKEVLPPVWAAIKLLVKEARRQDSLTPRF